MDLKDWGMFLGAAGVLVVIFRMIGENLVRKYFAMESQNAELRETFFTEKLNWFQAELNKLAAIIKENTEEGVKTRIKLQSLDHELAGLKNEIKLYANNLNKGNEGLLGILKSFNGELKIQRAQIETIGKVIMREPEKKR